MYTSCFKHTHMKRLHTEIQHLCQCCLLLHWVSRVNVEATAYAGSLLDPSHYPSVINDSVNTSSWLFKAPNVPTSTMWFQQSNPCVDNLPWKNWPGTSVQLWLCTLFPAPHNRALWKQDESHTSFASLAYFSICVFFLSFFNHCPMWFWIFLSVWCRCDRLCHSRLPHTRVR